MNTIYFQNYEFDSISRNQTIKPLISALDSKKWSTEVISLALSPTVNHFVIMPLVLHLVRQCHHCCPSHFLFPVVFNSGSTFVIPFNFFIHFFKISPLHSTCLYSLLITVVLVFQNLTSIELYLQLFFMATNISLKIYSMFFATHITSPLSNNVLLLFLHVTAFFIK